MAVSIYKPYTKMQSVPAGAILDRIIRQQKRMKTEVAAAAQLIPQRLNDLIMGNRRFTPQNSLALEAVLDIDLAGFFYLIQANHDIYLARQEKASHEIPALSLLTKTTFWDVDLKKVDWSKCRMWAIRRVLEYGNAAEIREIDRFYGHKTVMEVYQNSDGFRLYDQVKQKIKELAI